MIELSICIPSYNRFDKLEFCLMSLLQCKSKEFEIIIVDNHSPNDINDFIKIADSRIKIIKREQAVDGKYNVGDCLSYATGKFAMICLDKDYIDGKYLEDFISVISQVPDLCGGYCVHNKDYSDSKQTYSLKEKNTVKAFGFLSKHPSGDFYNTKRLFEFLKNSGDSLKIDPFSFDIYLAACASKGKMLVYNKSLVFTEREEDRVLTKSFSFSKETNSIFFFPQNRVEQFLSYLGYLSRLGVDHLQKKAIIKRMFHETAYYVTFGYQNIMKRDDVCNHYRLEKKIVDSGEMKENLDNLVFLSIKYIDKPLHSKLKIESYACFYLRLLKKQLVR